jgi:thymidylate synthase (FAD)
MELPGNAATVERATVPSLEVMLGRPIKVLDEGFIRVVDYMGDDSAVVQAARISYGVGTQRVHQDRGLIRYLMRHMHTTPFEMCEIKLHLRVPMDAWRQWIRHRTANVNEYSTRYSVAIDAAQRTAPEQWRLQSTSNRQGSGRRAAIDVGTVLSADEEDLHRRARESYEKRLLAGVAREQARKDLPLCTYTEAYWKIDLHNLLHFLDLRMSESAQQEIRAYALIIGEQIVAQWVPLVWEAFVDYRREAVQLSRIEAQVVRLMAGNASERALAFAEESGIVRRQDDGSLMPNREGTELESKLSLLGLPSPWRKK